MAWTDVWTSGPDGAGDTVRGISPNGEANILVDIAANATDATPFIELTAQENMISLDTDTGTLLAAGAFVMDARRSVGTKGDTLQTVIVAALDLTTHTIYNAPPGDYYFICTTDADTAGAIKVKGRGKGVR